MCHFNLKKKKKIVAANRPVTEIDRFTRFTGPIVGSDGSKPVQCKNDFLIEPDRFCGRSIVRLVGPADPVRFLKHWLRELNKERVRK